MIRSMSLHCFIMNNYWPKRMYTDHGIADSKVKGVKERWKNIDLYVKKEFSIYYFKENMSNRN